jgi:hypothetical protein
MNKTFIQLLLFLLLNFSLVAQQIVSGEYFFDTAPNQGAGTPISFTANSNVNHSMTIPTNGLNSGIHQLYVRVKNDAHVWSHYQKRMIYVIEPLVINNTQIVAAEWFIDSDPGVGNGTNLAVTSGNTVSGTLSLPNAMSPGIHHLYIRVKNNLGKWSHQHKSMFYVLTPHVDNSTTIVKGEYFFDTDPGIGNAIQISVTPATEINHTLNISALGLTPGVHNLFIRMKNNRGIWGHYQKRMLFVNDQLTSVNKSIVAAEYFIDTDPGLALGTPISILPGTNLLEDFEINSTSIALGVHYLYVRVKEDNGRWSHYAKHKFLICNDLLTSPTISGSGLVCQNSNLDLVGSTIPNATEYFWRGPNGFTQAGNTLTIPNIDFSANGLYTFYAVRPGASACDTAYTDINIEVLPTASSQNVQSICEGENYQINGNTYSIAGIYFDTLISQNGCDSIVETQLNVLPSYQEENHLSICDGESYSINGNTYTTSGTYIDVFQTQNGCDSTITTYLTVNPVLTVNNPQTICTGASYSINGNTYTVAGTYTDVLSSSLGCDSTVITELSVVNSFEVTNPQVICQGESYSIGLNTYSETGTYTDILTSMQGCDSIVTTQLTVNPSFETNNPQTICSGETYTINGNSYNSSGTYTDVFQSISGCDSVVTTELTVLNPILNLEVNVVDNVLSSLESNATYQWVDCANGNAPIANQTGQSFTALTNGLYAVELTDLTCFLTQMSACLTIDHIDLNEFDLGSSFKIYPNPVSSSFTIKSENIDLKKIKIYNLEGKIIFESSSLNSDFEINAINWSSGVYNIELMTDKQTFHQKIVKE